MIVIFLKAWAKGQIGFNADLLLTIWSLLAHIWMFVSGSQNYCFVRLSKSVVCCISVIQPCVNVKVVSVRIAGECEWVSRERHYRPWSSWSRQSHASTPKTGQGITGTMTISFYYYYYYCYYYFAVNQSSVMCTSYCYSALWHSWNALHCQNI